MLFISFVFCVSNARSQNLGLFSCKVCGYFPPMTPGGTYWLRFSQRILIGVERMAIQGVSLMDLTEEQRKFDDTKLCSMAGDMFHRDSFTCLLVGLFATFPLDGYKPAGYP